MESKNNKGNENNCNTVHVHLRFKELCLERENLVERELLAPSGIPDCYLSAQIKAGIKHRTKQKLVKDLIL